MMLAVRVAGVVALTLLCFTAPCFAAAAFSGMAWQNGVLPHQGCSHHQPARNSPPDHQCCSSHAVARPAAVYRSYTLDRSGTAVIKTHIVAVAGAPVTALSLLAHLPVLSIPLRV